jgi:deoxyhypusine synthase
MHHDHSARPGGEVEAAPGSDPLVPFDITPGITAGTMVDRMTSTAFQARNLGVATRIWEAALKDDATIFFGLSGAMVPAGMRPILVHMIENRMIDVIVSTGANLYHDVYESLGFKHGQTDPHGDDIRLGELRVVRFYDVLAPEHEFSRGERYCTEFAMTLDGDRPYTTREYFSLLGKAMAPIAEEEGILTAAAKAGVPIYCPAFGDSVHGLAVAEVKLRGKNIIFDVVGDVLELVHMSITANKSAVIYVGGGTPKNFIQQSGAACYLFDRDPPGHSYGIQITMDQPQWGGLSGCTFEEAQSWRKIAADARFATVNVEATVALPLIISALAERKAADGRRLPDLQWDYSDKMMAHTPAS